MSAGKLTITFFVSSTCFFPLVGIEIPQRYCVSRLVRWLDLMGISPIGPKEQHAIELRYYVGHLHRKTFPDEISILKYGRIKNHVL